MRFKCEKKDIIDVFSSASRILPAKGSKAEDSAILISTQQQEVQFQCTDKIIWMRSTCPATIETEGKILVPAHTIRSILSTFESGKVEFEADEKSLWVRCGKSKSKFQLIDPALFPDESEEKFDGELKIGQKALRDMLEATHYAVATDQAKPELTGIAISFGDKRMEAMAIDGYRMSVMYEATDAELDGKYIVPIKSIREIMHHLTDEGDVAIKISKNMIAFELTKISLNCRLLEGLPMDAQKIFPKDKDTVIKVNCDELIASVNRAAIVSGGTKPIRFSIDKNLTGAFVRVQSESETGECDEEIEVEMSGKSLNIKFNPTYVIDALKHIKREECIMEFQDALKPCVLSADEKASKHLILPVAS